MSRFIVVLLLAFVVSACGARDKVLLLPNDDGTSSGAVAVLSNKGETRHVIDKPYTEVAVSAGEAEFLFREGTRLRRIGERPAARSEQCVDGFLLNVASGYRCRDGYACAPESDLHVVFSLPRS